MHNVEILPCVYDYIMVISNLFETYLQKKKKKKSYETVRFKLLE